MNGLQKVLKKKAPQNSCWCSAIRRLVALGPAKGADLQAEQGWGYQKKAKIIHGLPTAIRD
jgi:hypothetical protein